MSLVVFPFKEEALSVVGSNLAVAASHERVDEVWAVAFSEGDTMGSVAEVAADVTRSSGTHIEVFAQDRLGNLRPGKGDGLNTALRRAAAAGFERIHFYDADITNFDTDWIQGAEDATDRGFEVVRHRFPRAATDAMITWMVTRPGLAKLFPGTLLPRLGQPLGGEFLVTGEVASALAANSRVTARSDWGIDTVITHATTTMGHPIYEHYVADGKRHALYGSLAEIRQMVLECLDAVKQLRGADSPPAGTRFEADPPAEVPQDLKATIGYRLDETLPLLTAPWSPGEIELAAQLPPALGEAMLANVDEPNYRFMGSEEWGRILDHLLANFVLGDPDWEQLAFRSWLARVLSYTTERAARGYDEAISYLEETIRQYEREAYED